MMRSTSAATSRMHAALATLALTIIVVTFTDAQSRQANRLTNAKAVSCVFSMLAVGTWNGTTAAAEIKPAKLSLGFDEINTEDGTARALGTFGPSDIIVKVSTGTLHLVQSFRDGPLYATTIFPYESGNGKLKAVHTRHEYTEVALPGYTSRPEQYYGECEIVE